ncbi:MAG: hypothetical protein [Siphoviridae sp. ctdc_1]|nr:MAG: hypothetical protein [Siphoviridae sp. ctdc_1]
MKILVLSILLLIASPVFADDKVMDIWITKYALTRGVEHQQARIFSNGKLAVVDKNYYRNSEFWYTEADANRQARKMKQQRIDSLVRELKRIQHKEFR